MGDKRPQRSPENNEGMTMTETPQTPPPAEPPPPAASRRPAVNVNADQMRAAVKTTHQYDLGIIAAGVLAFLFSLIPSYYTAHAGPFHDSFNAWHGFWGWFAAVLALAGAAVLAARLIAGVAMPFPVRWTVLGLFGVSLLCTIIAGLTWAGADTGGADVGDFTGHGVMYWLSLIVIVGGLALSAMRKDADA
jgi:hypothetical protein